MKLSDSVELILSNESLVLEGFYKELFVRYPEFEPFFTDAHLGRQTAMLTMALVSVKQYPVMRGSAHSYLQALGVKHRGRGIPAEMYPKFIEVLIEKVAEFHGDKWDDELHEEWLEALNLAAATMNEEPHPEN